ncbi:MAG: hypothetical protein HYS38_03860 [Acidobacteria bacterium]|nr:hypothetical protein [Acidobacteriota bacterium]
MTILEYCDYSKRRLRACLQDFPHYKSLEFPYTHSLEALEKIETKFDSHLNDLESLSNSSDWAPARAACSAALAALYINLPLLGFTLRSTEVRNAFEIYGPLLRLSRCVLGPSTKLILSSEWEYSPFTYLDIPALPGFVLIGLPSPESANPLLVPLAGHELGHSVWSQKGLDDSVSPEIESRILHEITDVRWDEYNKNFPTFAKETLKIDLSANQTWIPAYDWASSQVVELFCDFLGLRIFRESYLHAFSYLLAPNLGGNRPTIYPNMERRVRNLLDAANTYQTPVPTEYEKLFVDLPNPPGAAPQSIFLLDIADDVSQSFVPDLVSLANDIVNAAGLKEGGPAAVETIYSEIRDLIVPARNPVALSDILNAGWKAFRDPTLWDGKLDKEIRDRTLKELLLKSIEILEVQTRLEAQA